MKNVSPFLSATLSTYPVAKQPVSLTFPTRLAETRNLTPETSLETPET
jgi:hypothetical protein